MYMKLKPSSESQSELTCGIWLAAPPPNALPAALNVVIVALNGQKTEHRAGVRPDSM